MKIDSQNILYIIIGLVCLAIIGVVIYLITKPKSTSPPSNQLCSVKNLTGACPDTYKCTQGMCITTVPPSLNCSKSNPTGQCSTLGWICSGGTCTDPSTCSASNPKGSCTQYGTVCTNGTCIIPQSTDCSPTNLKGNCPTGLSCVGGTCTGGSTCPDSCNGINCGDGCTTCTGVCPPGQCINGKCSASTCPDRCNGINCGDGCTTCTGICPPGQCISGFCFPCPDSCNGINCGDGCTTCTGICPEGQTCVGGKCKTCTPDCTGKNCGVDDGCGTPCQGSCPQQGQICVSGKCTTPPIPSCTGNGDDCNNPMSCTCPLGTNCGTDGKCAQIPMIFSNNYQTNNYTDTDPIYLTISRGHDQDKTGCWSVDNLTDKFNFTLNKNHCSVGTVRLPPNIKASSYRTNNVFRNMCSGGIHLKDYDAGSYIQIPQENTDDMPCGFLFTEVKATV